MKPRDLALAVLIGVVWGVNFVVIKVGLDTVSPLLFCALRFSAAAIPAVFLVGRPKAPLRWILATALFLCVIKFPLLFAGMDAGLPAGLSALVLQSQVVFTLIFAAVLINDRPTGRRIAGVAVGALGIALIGWQFGLGSPISAFVLVVAAGLAWGLANIAMRKAAATDMLNFMVWVSAAATPPLVVMTLVVDGPATVVAQVRSLDLVAVLAVAYVAWLATLFGFGAWGHLIRLYGAGTMAPFTALAPVFAILSGALLLHESVTWYDLVGGAAIISGVLLGAWPARRRAAAEPTPEPVGSTA